MTITTERINTDFIIYLKFIFIIFFRIAFIKIRALYVTVGMRAGGVARWFSCPSVDYSPGNFIR